MKSLIKALAITILPGILYLGIRGCQGFNAYTKRIDDDLTNPTNVQNAINKDFHPQVDFYRKNSSYHLPMRGYIHDVDNDGIVDGIAFGPIAYFYSPEWQGPKSKDAREMTPKIRELSSQYLKLSKELAKEIYSEELKNAEQKQ